MDEKSAPPQSNRRLLSTMLAGPRKWWLAALLLALLVYLAPVLAAKTNILQWVVNSATGDLNGQVLVESADLRWFSGNALHGVRLLDADGNEAASAAHILVEKSLWQLLWSRDDLGTIVVEKPTVELAVKDGTTGLEEILRPLLEQPSQDATVQLRLAIKPGSISLRSGRSDLRVELDEVQGQVEIGKTQSIQLTARAWGHHEQIESGSVELDAVMNPTAKAWSANVQLESLGLEIVDVLAERLSFDWRAAGGVSGKVFAQGSFDGSTGEVEWTGLNGNGVTFSSGAMLGSDQPKLEVLKSDGGFHWQGSQLEFKPTEFRSDVVSGTLSGHFDLEQPADLWTNTDESTFETQGTVDLAVVAQQLPTLIKLREGIEVQEGQLQWLVRSHMEAGRRRLFVDLTSNRLKFLDEGQSITLDQPLRINGALVQTHLGPELEFVNCDSAFLTVKGDGSPYEGSIDFSGNLDRLQAQLGQFIDLEQAQLQGEFSGRIAWRQEGTNTVVLPTSTPNWEMVMPEQVSVGGNLSVQDIHIQFGESRPIHEPRLDMSMAGQWLPGSELPGGIEGLTLNVRAGDDWLELTSKAVDSSTAEPQLQSADMRLVGDLQRWLNRTGVLVNFPGYDIAGNVDLNAEVRWNSRWVAINDGNLTVENLRVLSPSLDIDESHAIGSLAGAYDLKTGGADVQVLTFATSTASLRIDELHVPGGTDGGMLRGRYAVRADLQRLSNWLPDHSAQGWACSGQLQGHGELTQQIDPDQTQPWGFDYAGTIQDFEFDVLESAAAGAQSPSKFRWQEPDVRVELQGVCDLEEMRLQLPHAQIQGQTQAVTMAGSIQHRLGQWDVDTEGRWSGTGHQWVAMLKPWLGEDAKLVGRFDEPFAIRGPLQELQLDEPAPVVQTVSWPPSTLTANGGLAWESGQFLGLPFGTGAIRPRLENRVLDFGDVHIPLQQGDVRLSAQVFFQSGKPVLRVEEGRVLDRVVMTPELSRRWLVYAAPLLAQIASSEGIMSLDVEESVIPLDDSLVGQGGGKISIERATVGPGPLAKQILVLIEQVRAIIDGRAPRTTNASTWLELPQQVVTFKLQGGRVYHDRLTAQVGDVVVMTRGSVGRDETLDLVVTIPIQESWLKGRAELAALRGVNVELPVRGTLSKPEIDTRVLGELSKQMLQRAAGQLLDQQLQRGLDKLFGGGR